MYYFVLCGNKCFNYSIQIFFWIKTGYSQIEFDVDFPMQSSEFIRSLNFGTDLKKKIQKESNIFHLKIIFVHKKKTFLKFEISPINIAFS